ncbi:hypothetical protein GGI07_005145 [Coemansia sp. Benny D115]|nr:hypothetical protein GGI07_005145 [Coemansia sp. Benny D115]
MSSGSETYASWTQALSALAKSRRPRSPSMSTLTCTSVAMDVVPGLVDSEVATEPSATPLLKASAYRSREKAAVEPTRKLWQPPTSNESNSKGSTHRAPGAGGKKKSARPGKSTSSADMPRHVQSRALNGRQPRPVAAGQPKTTPVKEHQATEKQRVYDEVRRRIFSADV